MKLIIKSPTKFSEPTLELELHAKGPHVELKANGQHILSIDGNIGQISRPFVGADDALTTFNRRLREAAEGAP